MALTIKQQVLTVLEAQLATVPGVSSVNRWEGRQIDLEVVAMPALVYFDSEEKRDRRGRYAVGTMTIHAVVFIHLGLGHPLFSSIADPMQADLHAKLVANPALGPLIQELSDTRVWKDFSEKYGALYLSFDMVYMHLWGNAYSI